ncbi:MAG: hypothetical protein K5659_00450 [Lachnospiraceae bacterium]|nr:hypothetical protein [Lachnospiraceae bacterium]
MEKHININDKHKDRLFNFVFGRSENREWTLSLYNAVNNSHYTDASLIEFNTLENVLYLKMRNDTSFLIKGTLNLYEHQSTYNPNMPLRQLDYLVKLFSSYIDKYNENIYGTSLITLPTPKLIVFYNGESEQAEETILKLSDSFDEKTRNQADIEVTVKMLNINYGHNKELMKACQPLKEYAWFVDNVRKKCNDKYTIEEAVDQSIDDMPDSFELKNFLSSQRTEVKGMLETEYNEEKIRRLFVAEERRNTERERQRADAEKARADAAEEEIKLLKEELAKLKSDKL